METNISQSGVVHEEEWEPNASSLTGAQRSFLTLKCDGNQRLQLVLTQAGSKQNLGHYVFNDGGGGTSHPHTPPSTYPNCYSQDSVDSTSAPLRGLKNNTILRQLCA